MKKLFSILFASIVLITSDTISYASDINNINADIDTIEQQEDSLHNTLLLNDKNKSIIAMSDIDFSNKKITCIGDSITYGNGGSVDLNGNKISYCNYLAENFNCEVINLGIGGSAIGDYWDENSLILRWQEIPVDSDIIIIFAGTNDFYIGMECFGAIESKEDKTYCGDTYSLFKNIKENYPNADIFVCTMFRTASENWDICSDSNLNDYMEVQRIYSDEFDFHIIDLYYSGILNTNILDISTNFVPDVVHPNDKGNEILANKISAEIISYYSR